MISPLGRALDIAAGRYWWVLVVRDVSAVGDSAQILCVMRGVGRGRSSICRSFSGTLEECRRFQIQHGGADDGVLLVDDATPVKIVSDSVNPVVDFPGYKPDCWDHVDTVSGDFSVVALRSAIESFAQDVQKVGFKIIIHLPLVLAMSEMVEVNEDAPCLLFNNENGFARLYLATEGKVVAGYKVLGENTDELEKYICEQYLVNDPVKIPFTINAEEIAKTVAEDAWLFKTDNMPSFHTPANKDALQRLRDAALFRRTVKACVVVLLLSAFVVLALGIVESVYTSESQAKIQAHQSIVQKQKDLALIWEKLDREKAQSEEFLKHRSRMSTTITNFASVVSEDIWVTHWLISGQVHSVQGYAVTSKDLSDFLEKLENDRSFINVRLRTTEKTTWKKHDVVRFDLTAENVR